MSSRKKSPVKVKTVYISGPITGIPNHNEESFDNADRLLSDLGYETINPINNDKRSRNKSWAFYMCLDMVSVAKADVLVLLPGWEQSKGAVIEIAVAERLEKEILEITNPAFIQDDVLYLQPIKPIVHISAKRPGGFTCRMDSLKQHVLKLTQAPGKMIQTNYLLILSQLGLYKI